MGAGVDSLERLIPDEILAHDVDGLGRETLALHLERYAFAAQHIELAHARPGPWSVVDAACGVGYGSALLAQRLGDNVTVHGVDLDGDALQYARTRYVSPHIQFHHLNALQFQPPTMVDAVVSLETLEHVPDPRGLLAHLVSLLKPGGVLVASAPVTPSVDANPYHLHDFTTASFRALLRRAGLQEMSALRQVQRFNPLALMRKQTPRAKTLRPGLVGYYATHPHKAVTRVLSTLRFGFSNHYLTIAARKH